VVVIIIIKQFIILVNVKIYKKYWIKDKSNYSDFNSIDITWITQFHIRDVSRFEV